MWCGPPDTTGLLRGGDWGGFVQVLFWEVIPEELAWLLTSALPTRRPQLPS